MNANPKNMRERIKRGLQQYFEKRRSPRFMLTLVILITALSGFGISFWLLKFGLTSMGLRYPAAVLLAYGIFLVLIRLWVEVERRHFDPEDPEIQKGLEQDEQRFDSGIRVTDKSWWEHLDVPLEFDGGEGCLIVLLMGVVGGLAALLIAAIGEAPVMIAEVFIDAVLSGMLYRRLRIAASEHWLGTAIRKTWRYVLAVAVLMCVAGFALDFSAKNSDTMGMAIKELLGWR